MAALRLGVLGSGAGSNFRAIQSAIAEGTLDAEVALVLSDVETAGILTQARRLGVPAEFVNPGPFRTKFAPAVEEAVAQWLMEAGVDYVVLAGFMRMIKAPLLEAFPERVINIHPSLLPAFPGLEAWRQALEAGVEETGCTVHYVDAGMDTGAVIEHKRVPILPDDTAETLHARIQVAEHELYPAVLRGLARK